MKLSSVRNIDYWFGVPICFALSILHKIQKLFIASKFRKVNPKKIVFLELSEIGAAIMAYSAMEKVKEMYPGVKLYFWIFRKNQDSVRILNIIPQENVISMRDKTLFLLAIDVIKNLWRIRKEKIDVIIDMELFSRFTTILSYLSGAKIRVGFHKFSLEGLYRGNMHTHKVSYNPYVHISKNFLSLVQSLEACLEEVPLLKTALADYQTAVPKIEPDAEAQEDIWRKLKEFNGQISRKNKIIILNPGINDILPLRKWPVENYIELAKKLLIHPQVFIVLVGIESDCSEEKLLHQEISDPRFINFIGKTTIRELIALYGISNLLISHDSGATNLASLTDIDIIVFFGPETPILYAPLTPNKTIFYSNLSCSPCISAYNHRRSLCRDNRCLKMITVEEVYKAAKTYL